MASQHSSPTSFPRFLALPAELRLRIYDDYFSSYSRLDPKDIYEDDRPCHDEIPTLPLLLVNKQVSDEVLDLLRKRKQFIFNITCRRNAAPTGFDALALSCFLARKIRFSSLTKVFAKVPHLWLEIHPPRPDSETDLPHILENIQGLCRRLGAIKRLERVSIVFLENERAGWCDEEGRFRASTQKLRAQREESDVKFVLDSLAVLGNVTRASVELPSSVNEDLVVCGQWLKEFKTSREESMMGLRSLDRGSVCWAQSYVGFDTWYEEAQVQWAVGGRLLVVDNAILEGGLDVIQVRRFGNVFNLDMYS